MYLVFLVRYSSTVPICRFIRLSSTVFIWPVVFSSFFGLVFIGRSTVQPERAIQLFICSSGKNNYHSAFIFSPCETARTGLSPSVPIHSKDKRSPSAPDSSPTCTTSPNLLPAKVDVARERWPLGN